MKSQFGFDYETDLPREGDIVKYTRNCDSVTLPVTKAERSGGFTEYWLGEGPISVPLFNINHSTGMANTHSSQGGRWAIVRRKEDIASFDHASITPEEQEFGAAFYDMMSDRGIFTGWSSRTRAIIAAIQAMRNETEDNK